MFDERIAALAALRRGRVARRELTAAGIPGTAIARRIRLGRLHAIYPGVYAVGHPGGGIEEELVAAWLYGGERSVITHRGAAQFYGLGAFRQIDVTAPPSRSDLGRLVFHRGSVPDGEWVERDGIRVSAPARMLLELCAVVPEPRMQRLFTEAEVQGLVSLPALRAVLGAHVGERGTRLLRRLAGLGPELAPGRIRSSLEGRFRSWVYASDLPPGEANAILHVAGQTYEIDYLWREQRVAVELDSRSTHDNAERFETDRERDLTLTTAGWRPVRVTPRRLDQPQRLAGEMRLLLGPGPSEIRLATRRGNANGSQEG